MIPRIFMFVLSLLVFSQGLHARDHIEIVGSSTVFDFAALVAEDFGAATVYPTPRVESIGSGGGFKRFCAGLGMHFPDITNASRRIKQSELSHCVEQGVNDVVEVKIGYDGIVVAMAGSTKGYPLTADHLYQALAKYVPTKHGDKSVIPNPYQYWSDIDASLPKEPILVYGPPPSSGTREAFVDLILRRGCDNVSWVSALSVINPARYEVLCSQLREDGVYLSAGENDQMIVQRLQLHKHAMGVFGFGVLLKNAEVLNAVSIDGFEPTFETIANNQYHLARPLYFYVKAAHYGLIPGLRDYVDLFMSANAWGYHGYLARKGMVPLSVAERANQRRKIEGNTYLTEQDWSNVSRRSLYDVGNAN